ncbi:hypothetical protein RGU74_20190 [Bacillus cereus]|uniref:hypothetical protein n=1 Tax=Bacillus cereus TaxID=1396 RepID=UPI0028535C0D|nr:hypothetical protein [Bacillus cereus]MDR4985944.1 hypothetical protein [Bacillus cereus]
MSNGKFIEALMQENKTLRRTVHELTRASEKKDEAYVELGEENEELIRALGKTRQYCGGGVGVSTQALNKVSSKEGFFGEVRIEFVDETQSIQ